MKTNNNSKSNFSIANIIVLIFSLVGMMVIINWISEKVSTWLADLLFPEEAKKKAAVKAAEPVLKQAIKNVKPVKFSDLEKTMGSLDKIVKEVINENQVPNNIREKIESNEEASKTFVNGKIYDKIEQFINDCKNLKRSKIGSHKVPDDSATSHWDICYAKLVKTNLTNAEKDWTKSFEADGFTRSRALDFVYKYFDEVNNYIRHLNVNVEKVSFEETDSIINKYFGEV